MRARLLNKYFLLLFVLAGTLIAFSFSKNLSLQHMNPGISGSGSHPAAEARIFDDVQEYTSWCGTEESKMELSRKKTIGNYTYEVNIIPPAMLALRSLHITDLNVDAATLAKFRQKTEEYGRQLHLQLRIADERGTAGTELLKKNLTATDQYYSRIEYCAFKMQQDISLVIGDKTLPCSFFHFERAYDAAPYLNFIAVFTLPDKPQTNDSEITFMLEDNLFGSGKVNLAFGNDILNTIPQLKLKGI